MYSCFFCYCFLVCNDSVVNTCLLLDILQASFLNAFQSRNERSIEYTVKRYFGDHSFVAKIKQIMFPMQTGFHWHLLELDICRKLWNHYNSVPGVRLHFVDMNNMET